MIASVANDNGPLEFPPEIAAQIERIAAKLGCSEEKVVQEFMEEILRMIHQPEAPPSDFVRSAQRALAETKE
jgi:hypothetical protein